MLNSSVISMTSLELLSDLDMAMITDTCQFNQSALNGYINPLTRTGHAAAVYGSRLVVFGGSKYDSSLNDGNGGLSQLNDVVYMSTNISSTSGNHTWMVLVKTTGELL